MIVNKPEQQKQCYGFVTPSVPEIQSYMLIKMYSPVTMPICVALDRKDNMIEWIFFFCSCIVPELCLSRLPK